MRLAQVYIMRVAGAQREITPGFSAIDFKPGSNWYHRATNVLPSVFGSFFNTKSFGNIIVENNASLEADGPIYRIGNLTVNTGSNFTTHTSGQTVVLGNMTIEGNFLAPAASTNALVLGGNALQTVAGSGSIIVPQLVVADNSDVALNKTITILTSANVYGKLNFKTSQINGAGSFSSRVNNTGTSVAGNLVAGSYQLTGVVGTIASITGLTVVGTGIPANTSVVGFSGSNATINLSQPITTNGSGVTLNFISDTAILATASPAGMDSTSGSVVVLGNKNYQSGTSWIINAATSTPFGVSSGSTNTTVNSAFVEINAPVTVNRNIEIDGYLTVNAKLSLRALDTVHILTGATINGTFNNTSYIVTSYNTTNGNQAVVIYDAIASNTLIPIGTATYYLPATVNPTAVSSFTASVFEGITTNGTVTGTPLSAAQKQRVVNAVWNINRLTGTGTSTLQLEWDQALEGSTFTTLPNTDIGIIYNTGAAYTNPIGTGNNATNSAAGSVSSFGAFSVGAVPPSAAFLFNPLPVKIYGNPDFNGGASSLNTAQPIVYTSSNSAVATIVAGNIHITGAGTTTITASQASDGFYPAASVSRTLTVNKANLTITADNKLMFEQQPVPPLTVTYSGFVYGETSSVLTTQPTVTTTATSSSAPGTYPISVSGATAANYTITFVPGVLTVQAKTTQTITFAAPATKTYGNADFATGASSTNSTIPITFTSSNPNVAIVIGNNIHIVGAGTTNITASQAGNAGYFAASDVTRTLTVNKANLTIRVRDTLKVQGDPNPQFTITYTGFVLGETSTNLLTQPTIATTATTTSSPGYYTITPDGATSTNYNITAVPGRLTILPKGGASSQFLNAWMSTRNQLSVRVYAPEPTLADIIIYDFAGRPMIKRNVFLPIGFVTVDMNVSNMPAGIYIVRVYGNGVNNAVDSETGGTNFKIN